VAALIPFLSFRLLIAFMVMIRSFFCAVVKNCSHVWLENPPTPTELGRYYGPLYDRFISRAAEHSPGRWERRKKSISVYKSSGALLDLGCGSGSFLEAMKNDGWKLVE
jgi:2-polyprenyl-3-methyl-5-hydroxy-6-metoxy-1,4-benzoquinol methylase